MLNDEAGPLARLLVIEKQMWLGEERRETIGNAETLGCLPCVICATCAPAVKLCATLVKMSDMRDNARNGDDRATRCTNERIINIYINGERHDWLSFKRSAT